MSAAYDIVDRTYDVVIVGPGSAALAAAPGVASAETYRDFDRRLNVGLHHLAVPDPATLDWLFGRCANGLA